MMESPQRKHY